MADKTSGVNAGRKDLTDSDLPAADPFAELTRIMGFDPRKAEGGTRVAANASTVEDFKIDLEQELMREFGEDEPEGEPVSSEQAAPAFEEPLPQIAAEADAGDEIEQDTAPLETEEVIAAVEETEEAPVAASEEAPAEDFTPVEFSADEPKTDEDDIPVIKLSPLKSEAVEPAAEEEAAPVVLADAEPVDEAELEAEFNALLGNQEQHEILDTSAEQLASVAQTAAPEEHAAAQPAVTIADPEEDLSVAFGFPEPEALDKLPEPEAELASQPEDADLVPLEAAEEEAPAEEAEEITAAAVEEDQPVAEVKAQEPAAVEEDDPFAMLAAMAQKYRVSEPNDSWRTTAPQFSRATPQINRVEQQPVARVEPRAPVVETQPARIETPRPAVQSHAAPAAPAPEIETIDVPDRAVAMADDLDIPEIEVAEEPPVVSAADDLDAEFNNLLQQMSTPQAAPAPQRTHSFAPAAPRPATYQPQTAPRQEHVAPAYGTQHAAAYEQPAHAQEAPQAYRHAEPAPSYERTTQPAPHAYEDHAAPAHTSYEHHAAARTAAEDHDDLRIDLTEDDLAEAFDDFDSAAMDDFDLDGDFEDDVAPAGYHRPAYQQPKRRGLLIAAIIGGVAILGVAGAVAFSMMGDAQGSAPELVKADQAPFKVRPENPGGTVQPNQESKVYETVARTGDANGSTQDKLISDAEEPIDLPDQLPQNAEEDVSMTDDGAAKSEDRIQAGTAEEGQVAEGDSLAVAPRKVRTMVVKPDGTLAPREELEPQAQNDAATQGDTAAADAKDEVANAIATDPKPAEPAAAAPADVAQEQTASIQPQPVVEGGWAVQIASETSEEAAKATYQKMLGRYSNVLDGKGVNIVQADIAGKGTFWRIRIPAESRDAAASMCNSFKSAGGKCFVTKS